MIRLIRETNSTNDLALEAAKTDAPHGACWVADHQTRGRGSRNLGGERRSWFSPPGANVYLSVLLRPDLPPAEATHMTLAAAVGVLDPLVETSGLDAWLKWPNDLFVGDRKLAGILTEAHTSSGTLGGVVVGVGLNVNLEPESVPEELADRVTSLRIESGRRWDRLPLILDIRDGIIDRCESFADSGLGSVIDRVQNYDRSSGRDVEVRIGDEHKKGISRGIGDDGHLRVEIDGEIVEMQAGDVRLSDTVE